MTKQNFTDITIILDASTSMSGDREKTRNAINEFIKGQQNQFGECRVSLWQFSADDGYSKNWLREIWHNLNVNEIKELAPESYQPYGNTALYDAVGEIVERTGARYSALKENDRPSKVLFVIMTDGAENSSKLKWRNLSVLKDVIQKQENVYSWNFLFLGADFNTKEYTTAFGLTDDRSFQFTKRDLVKSYKGLSNAVNTYRCSTNSKLGANFSNLVQAEADKQDNTVTVEK